MSLSTQTAAYPWCSSTSQLAAFVTFEHLTGKRQVSHVCLAYRLLQTGGQLGSRGCDPRLGQSLKRPGQLLARTYSYPPASDPLPQIPSSSRASLLAAGPDAASPLQSSADEVHSGSAAAPPVPAVQPGTEQQQPGTMQQAGNSPQSLAAVAPAAPATEEHTQQVRPDKLQAMTATAQLERCSSHANDRQQAVPAESLSPAHATDSAPVQLPPKPPPAAIAPPAAPHAAAEASALDSTETAATTAAALTAKAAPKAPPPPPLPPGKLKVAAALLPEGDSQCEMSVFICVHVCSHLHTQST